MAAFRKVVVGGAALTVKDVCLSQGLMYSHGCGYYELGHSPEQISADKLFVARNEKTGEILHGSTNVRSFFNIQLGDVKISSWTANKTDWKLYVNSTSATRKLKEGSALLIKDDSATTNNASMNIPSFSQPRSLTAAAAVTTAPVPIPVPAETMPEVPVKEPAPKRRKVATEPIEKKGEGKAAATIAPAATSTTVSKPIPAEFPITISNNNNNNNSGGDWLWHSTLMYKVFGNPSHSSKICAFDYDGCLANTSLFKKGPDAWSFLFPGKTETILKALHSDGYKFVIMSNQATIGKAKGSRDKTIAEKVGRFTGFVNAVGIPCVVMAATADTKAHDEFRKPEIGMWTYLEKHLNGNVLVDRSKSFFVGDACGRSKDHSDSDMKFAEKVGVQFYNETDFFVHEKYKKK